MNLLLAINSSAGTGHDLSLGEELVRILHKRLGLGHSINLIRAESHKEIKERSRTFTEQHPSDTVIIAGGGGGTLRAVIEGVGESAKNRTLPNAEQLRIGALRMGSGNVIARQLGIARNPRDGVEELAAQLLAKTTANCCVIGCDTGDDSPPIYGATLGGFGLFGHVPKRLETYHAARPRLHRLSAGLLGIEHLTNLEYGLCLSGLCGKTALQPKQLDLIEVSQGDRSEQFPLLAGALMNFPLGALPFQTNISVEDAELSLHLVPYRSRIQALGLVLNAKANAQEARQFRITEETPVVMRVLNREHMQFFIDEDPVEARKVTLRVAGHLAFVPGKNLNKSNNNRKRKRNGTTCKCNRN